MNKKELGQLYPIFLTDYDKNWPILFEKEKAILISIFDSDLKIEHIGSTAVAGLSAKPTIDILIEKPDNMNDEQIIKKMADNGYIHMKEQSKHLMFVKGYNSTGFEKESYHIHMGPLNQSRLWDRIFFRNYLNKNIDEARIYENLKKKLALEYKNDREAYTEGKSDYIKMITKKAKKEMQ